MVILICVDVNLFDIGGAISDLDVSTFQWQWLDNLTANCCNLWTIDLSSLTSVDVNSIIQESVVLFAQLSSAHRNTSRLSRSCIYPRKTLTLNSFQILPELKPTLPGLVAPGWSLPCHALWHQTIHWINAREIQRVWKIMDANSWCILRAGLFNFFPGDTSFSIKILRDP